MLIVFLLCFEQTSSCRSQQEIQNITDIDVNSNYSSGNSSNYSSGNSSNYSFGNSSNYSSGNSSNYSSGNSSNYSWGGWDPPMNDSSWKTWIAIWGTENSSNFDSTENERGSESGWPQYWKGLGKVNSGVPPPPWSNVPLAYGKPQFCFLQPEKGECDKVLTRWGYNPSKNKCQMFGYSGCGGNENNFLDLESCKAACVDIPSTGCETSGKINFEELLYE